MEHLYTNTKKTVIWERKRYILKENFSESTTWIQCFQISITMNHLVFIFEYLEQNGLKSDQIDSYLSEDRTKHRETRWYRPWLFAHPIIAIHLAISRKTNWDLRRDTSRHIFIRVCPVKQSSYNSKHSWKSKNIEHWYKYRRLEIFELDAKLLFHKNYSTSSKIVKNIKIISFKMILKTYLT